MKLITSVTATDPERKSRVMGSGEYERPGGLRHAFWVSSKRVPLEYEQQQAGFVRRQT